MATTSSKDDNKVDGLLPPPRSSTLGSMATLPLTTLSSLLTMQDVEDHKPRLSKMSWLPDILVYRASILPAVLVPVLIVTAFSGAVAFVSIWYDKEVGLTNNVVPLLSVVVGLLLVFRNTSAYERYSEGRKDFTSLISNARNLSRLIWITVIPPPPGGSNPAPILSRAQLTMEKKRLIRLIVAFVVATKHHLRAEGGVHHDDLRGLLPPRLAGSSLKHLRRASLSDAASFMESRTPASRASVPTTPAQSTFHDEESSLGLPPGSPSRSSLRSRLRPRRQSSFMKRRPTAVRVLVPEPYEDIIEENEVANGKGKNINQRTPLIKAGVKPDLRKSAEDAQASIEVAKRAELGLGRMVELGLPLIIAHEISRTLFRFRRMGFIETVGPAGLNTMQGLLNTMTDQLGAMERIVQTPMPYIIAVHMKQATTMLLFIMPFTLVDMLGVKMVPLMFFIALIYMGIEGIAAQVEQPFGTDPCDLNLDLYCTELLCECEAVLERLPEGDAEDHFIFERQVTEGDLLDDGDDGDGGE